MTFYNLNYLSSPVPFEIYEGIAKSKYKYKHILYENNSSKSPTYNLVKHSYKLYEKYKKQPENIVAFPLFGTTEKEALLHCYTGNTKLVRDLKTAIIKNQNIHFQTKCAYCGISDTHYMDHYLPKDDFPEFSVHSYNLVPCCSYCNEKKSKLFLDTDGSRKIFNPYFEIVEEEPIIICCLDCLDTTVHSHLKIRDDVSNKVSLNHISTLDLILRYESEVPRLLSLIMLDIIYNYEENGVNAEGAKRVLKRKLDQVEQVQGHNSLDAIIYRAYLVNDLLFDYDYLNKVIKMTESAKLHSSAN